MTARPGSTIPALDGVRGIAILLVLVSHFTDGARLRTTPRLVENLAHAGWLGVDLFFALSGFLITGILYDSRDDRGYFTNFYARRALRIFPLYYGVLLLVFVGGAAFGYDEKPGYSLLWDRQWQFWLYLTNFVQAIDGVRSTGFYWLRLSHFWSLAVEEQFYLFWPFFVYWVPRRALFWACAGVGALSLALRVVAWELALPEAASYLLTPCRADALALGGCAAILVRRMAAEPRTAHAFAGRMALAAIGVLSLLVAWRGRLYYLDPPVRTWGYSLVAVLFAASILWLVTAPETSLVARLCRMRWLMRTGTYSYGLYVYHNIVMGISNYAIKPPRLEATFGWYGALGIVYAVCGVVTLAVAMASYHLFEKHALKLKRYFAPRREPVAGAGQPPLARA